MRSFGKPDQTPWWKKMLKSILAVFLVSYGGQHHHRMQERKRKVKFDKW